MRHLIGGIFTTIANSVGLLSTSVPYSRIGPLQDPHWAREMSPSGWYRHQPVQILSSSCPHCLSPNSDWNWAHLKLVLAFKSCYCGAFDLNHGTYGIGWVDLDPSQSASWSCTCSASCQLCWSVGDVKPTLDFASARGRCRDLFESFGLCVYQDMPLLLEFELGRRESFQMIRRSIAKAWSSSSGWTA